MLPATRIQTPLIQGAGYNIECMLHSELETSNHILFVGEIVAAHLDEDAGARLLNFGDNAWARAGMIPDTVFRY